MVVRAPFDGVAISKDAQPGEMISPVSAGGGFTRTGICTIVDMSSLEIEVDVSETYINRVHAAQTVEAVLDAYPDWQIPAHVITTIPTADRQKATVKVRIGFEELDPRILPDMGVKVVVPEGRAAGRCATAAAAAHGRAEGGDQDDGRPGGRLRGDGRPGRSPRGHALAARPAGWSTCCQASDAGERVVLDAAADDEGRATESRCNDVRAMLVSVRDLHKVYHRGGERIDVLQGVNLDIPEGDFLALMGPSGSGKTTLLNLLGGLDTPIEGIDHRRRRSDRQAVGRTAVGVARAPHRLRLPALQPAAGADRGAERRAAAAADQAVQGGARASAWQVALSVVGLGERMNHFPAPALGRPGAARRHRARDRHRPDAPALRRADRRPRSQGGRRDPRPAADAQPASTARRS